MPLAAWLLTMVGPMAIRVICALGFTAVSFAAVTTASNALVSLAQSNWAAMPVAVLQLSTLSGIPQALGMIVGAYVGRVGVWAAMNGTKYLLRP